MLHSYLCNDCIAGAYPYEWSLSLAQWKWIVSTYTNLSTYLPVYLPVYLPTYLPVFMVSIWAQYNWPFNSAFDPWRSGTGLRAT